MLPTGRRVLSNPQGRAGKAAGVSPGGRRAGHAVSFHVALGESPLSRESQNNRMV